MIDLFRIGVRAHAVVDQMDSLPIALWKVTVWGEPPHALDRVYFLRASSDNVAAQEGLKLFEVEMRKLKIKT